jgi:hypothetical protein
MLYDQIDCLVFCIFPLSLAQFVFFVFLLYLLLNDIQNAIDVLDRSAVFRVAIINNSIIGGCPYRHGLFVVLLFLLIKVIAGKFQGIDIVIQGIDVVVLRYAVEDVVVMVSELRVVFINAVITCVEDPDLKAELDE